MRSRRATDRLLNRVPKDGLGLRAGYGQPLAEDEERHAVDACSGGRLSLGPGFGQFALVAGQAGDLIGSEAMRPGDLRQHVRIVDVARVLEVRAIKSAHQRRLGSLVDSVA